MLAVVDRSRLRDVASLYVWNAEFAEDASLAQMAVGAVLFQGRFGKKIAICVSFDVTRFYMAWSGM